MSEHLPKFREKKIDWKKVSWEGGLNPAECKRYWNYIQDRIRRFRIMAELVPDARHWIGKKQQKFLIFETHSIRNML